MTFTYTPRGVCSRQFVLDLEDGVIQDLKVVGGCHGNLQGVSALVKGMRAEDAIQRLEGICCGMRSTSCPDQLAKALKSALSANKE